MKSFIKNYDHYSRRQKHFICLANTTLFILLGIQCGYLYVCLLPDFIQCIPLVYAFFLILAASHSSSLWPDILGSLLFAILIEEYCSQPGLKLSCVLVQFCLLSMISCLVYGLSNRLRVHIQLATKQQEELDLIEKEKVRANLLRAISHDLRTPLTGIIGHSLVILERHSELKDNEVLSMVSNIYEDSTWLLQMVENLLAITRIKDKEFSIVTNPECVEEVSGEAIQQVKKRYPQCSINIELPENFILLDMDPILIEQVIINLSDNALCHSGNSSRLTLIIAEEPDRVSFTIRDYGHGIPQSIIDQVMDGSDHLKEERSDGQKGLGIGLTVCKTIIHAHHGTLSAANRQDGGDITFTIPKKGETSL